jgi:hypothetical protein
LFWLAGSTFDLLAFQRGPWRLPNTCHLVGFPSRLFIAPGLSFTLEDLTRSFCPVHSIRRTIAADCPVQLPWGSSPLRRAQSGGSSSRQGPDDMSLFPATHPLRRPGLLRTAYASPRHGFPHPLRSAFAVFHDLDGLIPPGPCDLFQPLTPMGFVVPSPLLRDPPRGPKAIVACRATSSSSHVLGPRLPVDPSHETTR